MAYHFSANQFEGKYASNRLQNWEVPKQYPPRPRLRRGSTKVISDERGHLLPEVPRPKLSSFSKFRSTYQLPNKITRQFIKEYDDCLQQRHKFNSFQTADQQRFGNQINCCRTNDAKEPKCPTTCETVTRILNEEKQKNQNLHQSGQKKKCADLEYIPGDFTPSAQQHESRHLLLEQKLKENENNASDFKLRSSTIQTERDTTIEKQQNFIDLQKELSFSSALPLTAALTKPLISPPLEYFPNHSSKDTLDFDLNTEKMAYQNSITGKPHERCPSPIVPAYANFELAKRMHQENLDHQPLPDCVADLAYRKLQISGGEGGLGLNIDPIATGVGIKTYNAGPTHCTKLKVFRPKTCGVVPRPYNGDTSLATLSTSNPAKEMGAMDLAICWDYNPTKADEPPLPKHIDGSNGSVGPAVFTFVKTPRDEGALNSGRSAGVFHSTYGEADFFDKDIMRRKTDFMDRNIEQDKHCGGCTDPPVSRARSVSRDFGTSEMPSRFGKQYKSTPNGLSDIEYKNLRTKFLDDETAIKSSGGPACRRSHPGFLQRAKTRLCKVAPQPLTCCHIPERRPHCKAAFRVGVPKHDASGFFVGSNSGCSLGRNGNRVLVVPRPRNPYIKKNYDIETLVPPFTAINGGASQGGYPEHWRLASVYQHSFKPFEQRRRPLLETVYK